MSPRPFLPQIGPMPFLPMHPPMAPYYQQPPWSFPLASLPIMQRFEPKQSEKPVQKIKHKKKKIPKKISESESEDSEESLPPIKRPKVEKTPQVYGMLDVDKIVKIESRPISPTKLSKDELLYQMDLKHFDKDEVVEKPEEIKKSRKEQREKPQFKEIEKEKHRFKGKRLWKAYAWAILQFFWLYKVVKNYRDNKKDNEDKPLHEAFNIMAQAIQVWLYDILKIPLTTADRINFDILNNPYDEVKESDKREFSFRRLSVRVQGIVKILIEQSVYMPEVAVKFLKKIFREGGYIPLDFWINFESKRIEIDDKDTLSNFTEER